MFCVLLSALAGMVLVVWIVRSLANEIGPATVRAVREVCAGCGKVLERHSAFCPWCGLHPDSRQAQKLRELESAARLVQEFRERGSLDNETCERVYGCIENRQLELLHGDAALAPVAAIVADAPDKAVEPAPLPTQLEKLLTSCPDAQALPFAHRRQALSWYGQLSAEEVGTLSFQALRALAQLVRVSGLGLAALRLERLALERHPEARYGEEALEAALLACQYAEREEAVWFLEQALCRDLPLHRRRAAEASLRDLRPPLVVEPVVEAPVASATDPAEPLEVIPLVEPVPVVPRRSLGEMLAGFMEERNILWGELVGGLLIVGCSIALVISLWRTLEQVPYFPFLIFAGFTAAVFGAGFYTLSHWKLESTSRGLLVIGTLLVPLGFLVLAGLSRSQERGVLAVMIEVISLGLFATLVRRAGRVLIEDALLPELPAAGRLLAGAVLGCAGCQLLGPRLLDSGDSSAWFLILGYAPVVCQVVVAGWVLWRISVRDRLEERAARTLCVFLGLTTFAAGVTLAFLLYWSQDAWDALRTLSVPVALAGIPVLVGGAMVQRRLGAATEADDDASVAAILRHGVLAVRWVGLSSMLAAMGLAWPDPGNLVLIGALNALVLTATAMRFGWHGAHVPAVLCLTLGSLTAFHWLNGDLAVRLAERGQRLLALLVAPQSAVVLCGLSVLLAASAELLVRRKRRVDAICQAAAAAALAFFCLALVAGDGVAHPARTTLLFGIVAAGTLIVNVRWRLPVLTYSGAVVLLGFAIHAAAWAFPEMSPLRLLLLALLTHASLTLVLSLAWRPQADAPDADAMFAEPLRWAALIASHLATPLVLLLIDWSWMGPLALHTAWIAALWLVIAWIERRSELFLAAQSVASLAVLFGVTSWLRGQEWVGDEIIGLLDGRSLQAYGIGLSVLGLCWELARRGARGRDSLQTLLNPPWLTLDRLFLYLLLMGQLGLTIWAVLPGVADELLPAGDAWQRAVLREQLSHVLGLSGWMLLAILALTLTILLWDRPLQALLGLVVVLVTVPILASGALQNDLDLVTTQRWGLTLCFVGGSVLLWMSGPLGRLAHRLAITIEADADAADAVRRLLLCYALMPALLLTVGAARVGFAGLLPPERSADWVRSLALPLALVTLALVGHGLRGRSAGYLFAAGLLAAAGLMGGQALRIVIPGGELDGQQWARLVQLGTGAVGVWALLWLAQRWWLRRSLSAWPWESECLSLQLAIGCLGNVCLILPALWLLLDPFAALSPDRGVYPPATAWVVGAGSGLGWSALLLVALAAWRHLRREGVPLVPHFTGMVSLGLMSLFACAVERLAPGWGFRSFLVGCGGYALLQTRRLATTHGVDVEDEQGALLWWLCSAGVLTIALSLKAACWHEDRLWAAAAILLPGVAFARLAFIIKRETWLFVAGLSIHLTVSLVVWHVHRQVPLADWWVPVGQANATTAGVVALCWLGTRRRIYDNPHPGFTSTPFLTAQCFLGLAAGAGLLWPALTRMLWQPAAAPPLYVLQSGGVTGWLGWLLAGIVAMRFMRHAAARHGIHVAGIWGLLLGVVAACTASRWDRGGWLAQHTLAIVWSLVGLAILGAGWAGRRFTVVGPIFWSAARRASTADLLRESFPPVAVGRWVTGFGLAVVALALRGAWGDPARPYASSAAVLAASALIGALAVWSSRPLYVYISGALSVVLGYILWQSWLIDEIGVNAWVAWGPDILDRFLFINVVCLAGASLVWSAIGAWLRHCEADVDLRGGWVPFPQVANLLALQLLALLVLGGLAADLTGLRIHVAGPLAWWSLVAVAAALAMCLWDSDADRYLQPGLSRHATGLLAIGLSLHAARLTPHNLGWTAAPTLAGYVLLTTALLTIASRWRHRLNLSEVVVGFLAVQGAVAGVAAALAVWISLDFDTWPERMIAPLTTTIVFAAVVLALSTKGHGIDRVRVDGMMRHIALVLIVVALTETAWVFLDPVDTTWLNHVALLLIVVIVLSVAGHSRMLGRLLSSAAWLDGARRTATALTALAYFLLVALVAREFLVYDPVLRHTPMTRPIALAVCAALIVQMTQLVRIAALPGRNPFGFAERHRSAYVYLAEALVVLMLFHVRLNVPDLIPPILGRYWALATMAVAFAGLGLSEWLRRRGLMILAKPLRRTAQVLPWIAALSYTMRPVALLADGIAEALPGLQPLFRMLQRLPDHFALHATLWFLGGLFYTLAAFLGRSARSALLAAVAVNFGLWVVWANHEHLAFSLHPQLWLIPPALIVLAVEQLYRDRLVPQLGNLLCGSGLALLYLSSTADMFITGLGQSVVLPVVLAILAILGVLSGIMLRVRMFLAFGFGFLFVDVFAQIWHAAVDRHQTWVWWASGIVLGTAILTLFALFEKRRNDLLRLLADLRTWR